jgi:hypothetical protein
MRALVLMIFLGCTFNVAAAKAQPTQITCQCGAYYQFPNDPPGGSWSSWGEVTFTSEVSDQSYWSKGLKLCQQKYHSLQVQVAGCDYAVAALMQYLPRRP